ncbi:MAG TPA: tRNA (adenosine(37)-N6)-threonylcarbamoyltransferase complex dimerization subunit type 1 TsaB [Candidatus Saccharimonadales bacterium]|nr:tRNA (adenosine(37)-N6)-threonylcarbamoyltransferase complex dimerization subunit type 1 TsaB [Candidatus Saccharimonadales bacterium]
MRILGIDTATSIASVALVEDGHSIAEELHDRRRATIEAATVQLGANHTEFILPSIQSLLDKTHTALSSLSGIAVTVGPGSFTGLRIGLATVKGLAYECGIPVVGVSTLHSHAARVRNFSGLIGSLLDARKSEVYVACFRCDGGDLRRLTGDAVTSVKSVIELLQKYGVGQSESVLLIGDGAIAHKAGFVDAFGASVAISDGTEYGAVAAQVARLAEQRFRCRSVDDIGALEPAYLRLPEAESRLRLSTLTS